MLQNITTTLTALVVNYYQPLQSTDRGPNPTKRLTHYDNSIVKSLLRILIRSKLKSTNTMPMRYNSFNLDTF